MFNIQAAKQAGYTDQMITDYLAQTRGIPANEINLNDFQDVNSKMSNSTPATDPNAQSSTDFLGGVADIVRQPATYVAKLGSTIGEGLARAMPVPTQVVDRIKNIFGITNEGVAAFKKGMEAPTVFTASGRDNSSFKTKEEFAGETAQAAANLATPALGAGGLGARIATGAAIGVAQGAGSAMQKNQTWSSVLSNALGGGVIGGTLTGAGELVAGTLSKTIPKLLTYTADFPKPLVDELQSNPKLAFSINKDHLEPPQLLKLGQDGIMQLRSGLTTAYKEGKKELADLFSGEHMIFSSDLQRSLDRVSTYYNLDNVPRNPGNVSVNEGLKLLSETNNLYSKLKASGEPAAVAVRDFRTKIRTDLTKNFGGKEGPLDTFLSNYGSEANTINAVDEIFKAYKQNSPTAMNGALTRLYSIFNENKSAYLSAVKDFQEKTGLPILENVVKETIQPVLPQASKLNASEILRLIALPLTSPNLVGKTISGIQATSNVLNKPVVEAGRRVIQQGIIKNVTQ